MKKKVRICLIALGLILSLVGCGQTGDISSSQSAENQQEETQSENSVVYEAIFLDNDEITDLFTSVRGETAPFENVTSDYHVTTEFMPSEAHSEWYGEKVKVHITSYAVQDVTMDDGQTTANEGFKAEVTSEENEDLNEYLKSLDKNYHITGSYKDGAKYTEYLDFSDGEPLDIYVTGTFGGYYSDGNIYMEKQ